MNRCPAEFATPLITAADRGHAPVVQLLLEAKASTTARWKNGETALDCAARRATPRASRCSTRTRPRRRRRPTPSLPKPHVPSELGEKLTLAAHDGDIALLKRLLKSKALDVDYVDAEGFTALRAACFEGHFERGAAAAEGEGDGGPAQWRTAPRRCTWPVRKAVTSMECAQLLLEAKAAVDQPTKQARRRSSRRRSRGTRPSCSCCSTPRPPPTHAAGPRDRTSRGRPRSTAHGRNGHAACVKVRCSTRTRPQLAVAVERLTQPTPKARRPPKPKKPAASPTPPPPPKHVRSNIGEKLIEGGG